MASLLPGSTVYPLAASSSTAARLGSRACVRTGWPASRSVSTSTSHQPCSGGLSQPPGTQQCCLGAVAAQPLTRHVPQVLQRLVLKLLAHRLALQHGNQTRPGAKVDIVFMSMHLPATWPSCLPDLQACAGCAIVRGGCVPSAPGSLARRPASHPSSPHGAASRGSGASHRGSAPRPCDRWPHQRRILQQGSSGLSEAGKRWRQRAHVSGAGLVGSARGVQMPQDCTWHRTLAAHSHLNIMNFGTQGPNQG